MRFLGPVTQLGDRLVRPHDLRITPGPAGAGGVTGRITRVVRVGFEVRVEITTDDQVVTVTLPRNEFLDLDVPLDTVVTVHEAFGHRLTAQTA